jgi:hypothetical protein
VEPAVTAICRKALPITLAILREITGDMRAIGMDPHDLVASISELFQASLETIGYAPKQARRLIVGAAASVALS